MSTADRSDARQIIRALRSGTTPSQFADRIFVGQQTWFDFARKMMEENSEDHHFEIRFVRAAYGGGKTLFMRRLERVAREGGWATAYILLRHGKVELDKPHTLVAELGEQLDLGDGGRGILSLLRAVLQKKAAECNIIPGRSSTLAAHAELENRIRDLCTKRLLGNDINIAMRQACRAYIRQDSDRLAVIAQWIGGGASPLIVPSTQGGNVRPLVIKPLGIGAAEQLMRLVAEFTLAAGKRGLYVALDEVELIAGFPERRRANAFQTLRALVDQNDPNTLSPATSIFLAATPQMFEDKNMFPSYKALQDRIETLPSPDGKRAINYRANVIDLDATKLTDIELRDLGKRIIGFWAEAGEQVPDNAEERIEEIVHAVTTRTYSIARPRLFCKLVVDLLDGTLGMDLAVETSTRASAIRSARDREVVGA